MNFEREEYEIQFYDFCIADLLDQSEFYHS